jgi:paraquat-inducible protein B
MRVEMGSLTTLFGGGVSFDVPEGLDLGSRLRRKRLSDSLTIKKHSGCALYRSR